MNGSCGVLPRLSMALVWAPKNFHYSLRGWHGQRQHQLWVLPNPLPDNVFLISMMEPAPVTGRTLPEDKAPFIQGRCCEFRLSREMEGWRSAAMHKISIRDQEPGTLQPPGPHRNRMGKSTACSPQGRLWLWERRNPAAYNRD